jgi:tight adherence protein B
MGEHVRCARQRSAAVALLTALLLTATASTTVSAAPAPTPGAVTLSDVRVTQAGVSAILTARAIGGAKIDPASVTATIGGVRVPVSVQPIAQERRVSTLLIDTSGSMGAEGMQTVMRATDAFLASVPTDVYVGVVAFSTGPKVIANPTLDRATVRTAIAGLRSQGETSLYDGLVATLAQLGTSGDRSFTLLSDGGDTRSQRTLAQTLTALSASGVRAQVVGFKTTETQTSVLTNLASAGHGSVVAVANSAAVSAAFKQAAQALESQIRLFITVRRSAGGIQLLAVSATAGGTVLKSSESVNLAVHSPAPSASPAAPPAPVAAVQPPAKTTSKGPLGMAWILWAAVFAIFLGLAGVVVAMAMPTFVSRRQRRLEAIEGYVTGAGSSPADEKAEVSSISASLISLGDKVMDSRSSSPKTQRLLERADLPLRLGEWAVLRVVAIVVGVAGVMVLMHGGPVSMFVGACIGGLLGVIGPTVYLKFAASRRAKKFERQLPDVLTLVASSLSTGFSLLQALDAVARDAAEPSAKEFSRALAETRIGTDLNESLNHLADRMESTNLRWTAMAINIQRQVGGNLAETLRNTATTLRDRESLKRHVNALSAEGKLSAYILIALPIGIFLYMLMVNRPYVELLWTTMIGIGMLIGGLISLAIGIFWMRKVVIVEV